MLLLSQFSLERFGKMSAVFLSCLAFGVITLALLQSAEAQIKYTVTRLVPISGSVFGQTSLTDSRPYALNAQGDVVGVYHWRDGGGHIFLNHAGIMHDIGALGYRSDLGRQEAVPTGINIYGRIVGSRPLSSNPGDTGAFTFFDNQIWSLSSTILDLLPVAVNTAGHIACSSDYHGAFIWQKTGLTAVPGGANFIPRAMNNSDQLVGESRSTSHAALSSGGQIIDLGAFINKVGYYSDALAINDQGQIVGWATVAPGGGLPHAVIFSGGKLLDIQTIDPLSTDHRSQANGINNAGLVVGDYNVFTVTFPETDVGHAFIYDGKQMIDLQTLIDPAAGWTLDHAAAINDAGQIIATGYFAGVGDPVYEDEACLLTPVR